MGWSKSLGAKVLLWSAAALMPWDGIAAAWCGCVGPQRPPAGREAFGHRTVAPRGCCRGGGVKNCCCHSQVRCRCGHKGVSASCCQGQCSCGVVCLCRQGPPPAPSVPSASQDSQTAKELCRQPVAGWAVWVLPETVGPCWQSPGEFLPGAATPPQRCSILCRFLL